MSHSQILVVEDDLGLREALVDTLLMAGYQCDEVDSGEAALVALGKKTYDMVVSDIQMGGMNGLETYRKILRLYPGQKAIITSGYSKTEHVTEAMQLGAGQYIRKPYLFEDIARAVKTELL